MENKLYYLDGCYINGNLFDLNKNVKNKKCIICKG